MRFVSHLDMTRIVSRIIRRAKLPVWFTEGFNPRPYITFALPLSLGHESEYDIMDIRILDDDLDISKIPPLLSSVSPEGLSFTDCFLPQKKAGEIGFASFNIDFDDMGALSSPLKSFLASDSIVATKTTKRNNARQIDIKANLKRCELSCDENTRLFVTLPAGSPLNINPELLLTAFFESGKSDYYCYRVTRTEILDKEGNLFK